MSVSSMIKRFSSPPPRNVGGGDMVTRVFGIVILLLLAAMIAPQSKVSFSWVKIGLLVTAELGLVSLMLGLFLRSKTYFTGLQLFFASMLMLWFTGRHLPWLALVVALVFVGVAVVSLVTRKSRLNALLELTSLRVPIQEAEAAAAAAPVDPKAPLTKTLAEGGAR